MGKRIILASGSPRRSELLTQIGIPFEVITSQQEEIYKSCNPCEIVQELAQMKARHVARGLRVKEKEGKKTAGQENQLVEDLIVIGADTIVVLEGEILEKPLDAEEAFSMISKLQGRLHQVYTGVALIRYDTQGKEQLNLFTEETKVYVHPMSDQEIREYIAQGECFDKAGGYGIQGKFAAFIERIEGDYYNVMGLPLSRVYQELKRW